jgi:hypothetical protein
VSVRIDGFYHPGGIPAGVYARRLRLEAEVEI